MQKKSNWKVFSVRLKNKDVEPLFSEEEFLIREKEFFDYKCLKCNTVFQKKNTQSNFTVRKITCERCMAKNISSPNCNTSINCLICNEEIKIDPANFVTIHLKRFHNITGREYYDKFLKKEGEGTCQNENCNNLTKFKGFKGGYDNYCSKACTSRCAKVKEKAIATRLRKTGFKYASQCPETKKGMQEKLLREKGVINVFQLEEVKKKSRETNIKKTGHAYPMENPATLEEAYKTCEERYGFKRPAMNLEIQKKTEEHNLKVYGVKSTALYPPTRDKIRATNQLLYKADTPWQSPIVHKTIQKNRRKKYWDTFVIKLKHKKIIPLFDKDFFVNNDTFEFQCLRCNKKFKMAEISAWDINCGCLRSRSKYEDEIIDKLKELNIIKSIEDEVGKNVDFFIDGKKKESDIFLINFNLSIDYCGFYWHSYPRRKKLYHQEKYLFFKKKGVPIIQVFEDEWINKESLVLSIIKNKINKNNVIYARKCEIKEILPNEYKTFLELYHIQGPIPSFIKLGMFYNSELVSVMGIGKSRYNKKYEYEIIRSCSKLDTSIVGGFSKFISYFEKKYNPKNIISYIDVRYFNGSSYEKNGFTFLHLTKPNYYYYKNNNHSKLLSRIQFQKHKLKNILDIYDENKTEYENMKANNYYRIYDAGNLVYVKNYNDKSVII